MFEKITPEMAGISSDAVREYVELLLRRGATTHSILMMKGDKIFAEYYFEPFGADVPHRMYSVTKSLVSIGIGLLIDEGKISLDDPIADFFPEKYDRPLPENLARQTIREMLTMSTVGGGRYWFTDRDPDRVHLYFDRDPEAPCRPSGVVWQYDSSGSQVLCALVEKCAGTDLLTYLRTKVFDKLGTFGKAEILKTPTGVSWGDSAMVCTARDIASAGRFLLDDGVVNGERLLSHEYIKDATAPLVPNATTGHAGVFNHGYGYQIWQTEEGSFAFVGMGDQLVICTPKTDTVFVITSDNQGTPVFRETIVSAYMDLIVRKMKNAPLKPNAAAEARLARATRRLTLRALSGLPDSPERKAISGREYLCEKNRLGITRFSFVFKSARRGEFRYENAQGEKVIPFGVNENVFGSFPEEGYSDGVGGQRTTGFYYRDAVSLAWLTENRLMMKVQVIDRYFGNFSAVFGFRDGEAYAHFEKTAEDFFDTYEGELFARAK